MGGCWVVDEGVDEVVVNEEDEEDEGDEGEDGEWWWWLRQEGRL